MVDVQVETVDSDINLLDAFIHEYGDLRPTFSVEDFDTICHLHQRNSLLPRG